MPTEPEFNIRAAHCLLFRTHILCPCCNQSTAVYALGFPFAYQRRAEEGDDVEGDCVGTGLEGEHPWFGALGPVLVSLLQAVSAPAARELSRVAPRLRPDEISGFWLNHCAVCDGSIADNLLHEGPGDAFMPASSAEAQLIEMQRLEVPCAALTGCSCDFLPWLESVRRT